MTIKNRSLRVQSILYKNDILSIKKSIDNIANSIVFLRRENLIDYAELVYGDCSDHKIFSDEEIGVLNEQYKFILNQINFQFFNENLGFAKGHNVLMKNATTEFLLIINPDVILTPHSLRELVSAFSDPAVGIAEARQVPMEHPKEYDLETGETSWASGACMLTRTELAHNLNGFDDVSFFMYCEDVDFSWRAKLAGFKVVFKNSASIFHDKRVDEKGHIIVSSAEEYYCAESALVLAYKYSRMDLVDSIKSVFMLHGTSHQKKALAEYEKKVVNGGLPTQIDSDHKVAQFVNGNYATHRF